MNYEELNPDDITHNETEGMSNLNMNYNDMNI
jgi:hypothetical protein